MGVRYAIEAGDLIYKVVDDTTDTYGAVFIGSLVDEITGGPIVSVAELQIDLPGIALRVAESGIIGGSAEIDQVFPKLSTTAYSFTLKIAASGYGPITLTETITAGAALPLVIAPVVMRRLPIRLQGRAVKASDRSGVSAAVVSSKVTSVLLLRDIVRRSHPVAVTVNALTFSPAGSLRKLVVDSALGSTELILDNDSGISAGDHLLLGDDINGAIYEVASFGLDTNSVILNQSTTSSYLSGTAVQPTTASAPSASTTLARSADAGDGVLILAGGLTGSAIEIADGALTEYHWVNALSDVNGYYHTNGVTGVQSLELLCTASGFSVFDQPWFPDYSDPVNVLDFRLRP